MIDAWVAPILNRLKGIKEKITDIASKQAINIEQMQDVQEILIMNALLSDDITLNEWAFKQNGIGSALNQMFSLQSNELAQCTSVNSIAANSNIISIIAEHEDMVSLCAKNIVLRQKLVSNLNAEDILYYGYGYTKYAIGDLISLEHYGTYRPFRVIAKDYLVQGKILLFSEFVFGEQISRGYYSYSCSNLREYCNTNILSGFSNKIQDSIVSAQIPCHSFKTPITCKDKIFPLSTTELGYDTSGSSLPLEGTPLPYFDSAQKRKRQYVDDSMSIWCPYWTRTPNTESNSYSWYINQNGEAHTGANGGFNSDKNYVAFAFLI